MNNWRLLLLALVAVFQPIESFTEHNLVDGRHQCCDRQSPAAVGDTRSSLHGTYRLDKTASSLKPLNVREEIREDRRYKLRQRDSRSSRIFTERPLVDSRERGTRQGPSITAKSSRAEILLGRVSNDESREKLLNKHYLSHKREIITINIEKLKLKDQIRDVRAFRNALEHRNVRSNTDSMRNSLSRDNSKSKSFNNDRLSENLFNSQYEMHRLQFRPSEQRFKLRETRNILRRARNDVFRTEAPNYLNNRQRISREKLSVVRRETLVQDSSRQYITNYNEPEDERRSLSRNTRLIKIISDMRIRRNSREENREPQRRISAIRRVTIERFDERQPTNDRESRQEDKENIDRRLYRERIQLTRISRENRNTNEMNNQKEKNLYNRREISNDRRLSTELRENSMPLRERIQIDRRNNGESRIIMNTQNERDIDSQRESRHNERLLRDTRDEIRQISDKRVARDDWQTGRRDIRESRKITSVTKNERDSESQRENRYNDRLERDVDSRREIRKKERLFRDSRDEIRENTDKRLTREIRQIDRRDIRESKTITCVTTNERDFESRRENRYNDRLERNVDSRREIRQNERLFRDSRDEIRENSDRRLTQKIRDTNRWDIPESRRNIPITRNEINTENWQENRRQIRDYQYTTERRVESRFLRRATHEEKDKLVSDRRVRSLDRLNFRVIRDEPRLSRSADITRASNGYRDQVDQRNKIEIRDRDAVDSRFRHVELPKNHERISSVVRKTENDSTVRNWQNVLYTLQGAYLCALFMQMLIPSRTEKVRQISLRWLPLSSYYNPIKVD